MIASRFYAPTDSKEICIFSHPEDAARMASDILGIVFYSGDEIPLNKELTDKLQAYASEHNYAYAVYIDTSPEGFSSGLDWDEIGDYPCKIHQTRQDKLRIIEKW